MIDRRQRARALRIACGQRGADAEHATGGFDSDLAQFLLVRLGRRQKQQHVERFNGIGNRAAESLQCGDRKRRALGIPSAAFGRTLHDARRVAQRLADDGDLLQVHRAHLPGGRDVRAGHGTQRVELRLAFEHHRERTGEGIHERLAGDVGESTHRDHRVAGDRQLADQIDQTPHH